jgi:TolA-binding protein
MALLVGAPAATAQQPTQATPAKPSAIVNFLGELWARLRAAGPRSGQINAPTLTAGLRGAEATETELKVYWKGDREQDPAYLAERKALQDAQDLGDAGKYAEAARAFDAFLEAHPRSTLAPNAQFGAALARLSLGDKVRARAAFEAFVKQNPQHALAHDAEQALATLR